MTWLDFRKQLALHEHVQMSSIQLVCYDKEKFDFDMEGGDCKKPDILISNVYTNNIVKYQVKDNKIPVDTTIKLAYENAIDKEVKERVAKMFPFCEGTPDWAISLLLENNNIDDTEKVI